jgi:hypothetical protein
VTCTGSCSCASASAGTSSGRIVSGVYPPNADCQWLIASNHLISISFTYFDMDTNDYVKIARCTSPSVCNEQIASSYTQLTGPYTSNTGYLRVQILSNHGWQMNGIEVEWSIPVTSKTCIKCPSGTYSNTLSATSCTACPSGTYTNMSQYSSTVCDRFIALMLQKQSFASISTRNNAPSGSSTLPAYNALGGPKNKGHLTFAR